MSYWSAWRAAHPEYVARERRRMANRVRGDRSSENARTRERARRRRQAVDEAPIHHQLLEAAEAFVPPLRSRGGSIAFAEEVVHEDAIQVAVVAMLEHRDPRVAVAAFLADERRWARVTAELLSA